jgi:hypothetical protein
MDYYPRRTYSNTHTELIVVFWLVLGICAGRWDMAAAFVLGIPLGGMLMAAGGRRTELGKQTAKMAVEALQTGKVPAHHVMAGGIITVNTETAAALGLDHSVFSTMANTVKEVTTGE